MGLMDKVKAQAQQIAQQTKDAAEQGKARLDQAQASRRGDVLLRQLGVAVYSDRTGRGTPDSQSKIDQLINDISAHERENGLNLTAEPTLPQQSTVPPQPTFPPDPPSTFPGGQPANEYGPSPFGGSGGPAQTSFPDAGTTSFPDSGSSFPGSGQESGGTTAFPPEG
ncbi:MAG TPA: hypothetical protein VEL03_19830 [Streptosporangiaceae bacterium]|nr:hypothetical protein [Streptosporangiaceae bacterium]